MQILLAVGFGGALGAVSRYWLAGMLNSKADKLPLGTLSCNVIGSLVMGILFVLIMEKAKLSPELRPMLMVGFLGAFTTFSSFSLETVALLQEGHTMSALIYVLLSVILCIIALSVGIWFTRLF
ncbi:fluoride efflux transporter CrcB [Neptunomonas phycophila]|jgi:CrcB protein|uniref:Fluoride-specific ion channel FluC n=1 Tax=Neptunomonas phycophila TaxID=1572645 RepID=A0AAW7XDB3_9GAMM|nr:MULTISPECIES: fluoride efflux transporter CrcB [Neptunomonas]MBT3145974.1 fluoride efflux transporter CrcB [Neptunomonas phycophila]MDN2659874.1 fluoride efflux transporter CrcB [Neptunomonas sp. CHC150]MDO6452396.1 fluoride efflux transporter CrcB [Neptunomonas phycophila]MDO6467000.1 fluoride efflux transporter CrcB [Neptunomonas phycophila]MDO6783355.1 fluoride efflux transporter CrcB [Neptunomonas phycophila]